MSQLSQTVANVIRFIALLVACLASTVTPTAHALGSPIGETVYIGYDATAAYDGSQNSSSAYEDAARPPTADEKHVSGAARTFLSRFGDLVAAKTAISNPGANGFVLVGEGSLHSTVAVRQGSMVNRVFDSGFATNPAAAQPLGRYFGEGGVLPSSAGGAITSRGLNLPGIIKDAQMGAVYRASTNIPALRGPAAGGTRPELIIDPSYFRHLELQGGYNPIAP